MNIIKDLVKRYKKDKKDIAILGIILPDEKLAKNKKLKPIISQVQEDGLL